jgi:hypothetical protein
MLFIPGDAGHFFKGGRNYPTPLLFPAHFFWLEGLLPRYILNFVLELEAMVGVRDYDLPVFEVRRCKCYLGSKSRNSALNVTGAVGIDESSET